MDHAPAEQQRPGLRRQSRLDAAEGKGGGLQHSGISPGIHIKHAVRLQIKVSLSLPLIQWHLFLPLAHRQPAGLWTALIDARIGGELDLKALRGQMITQAVEIHQRPPLSIPPMHFQPAQVSIVHTPHQKARGASLHRLHRICLLRLKSSRHTAKNKRQPLVHRGTG